MIGIGAAVTRRPLPHHRTYGSVYGGSRWLRRHFLEQCRQSERFEVRNSKALQTELWPSRDTRGRARSRQCCLPTAAEPRVPREPPCDDSAFSTAATELP